MSRYVDLWVCQVALTLAVALPAACVCALLDAPASKSLLGCDGGRILSKLIKCLLANEDAQYASTLLDLAHTLVENGEEGRGKGGAYRDTVVLLGVTACNIHSRANLLSYSICPLPMCVSYHLHFPTPMSPPHLSFPLWSDDWKIAMCRNGGGIEDMLTMKDHDLKAKAADIFVLLLSEG